MRTGVISRTILIAAMLCVAALGCSKEAPPPPKVFDDPLGPIVKTVVPKPAGLPAKKGDGPVVSYFANGFAKVATAEDRLAGRSQLRFYNPMDADNEVRMVVYFDNRPPEELIRFTLKPNNNDQMLTLPANFPGFFDGSKAWGARIESTYPVLALNVLSAGVIAPNGDLWFGDSRYKGSNVGAHATRRLEKQWFFGDGLVLKGEKETETQRFNEYEWYHILNPNPRDAEIELHCYYRSGESDVFKFTVKAERVRIFDNKELVRPNVPHAVECRSSEPVLVSADRFIYDFKNTEDWGAWLHANHEGIPGPEITAGGH
jgi:hypothetical protein